MKHSAKLFSLLVAYLFMAQLTYAHRWYVDNSIRVNTYYLDFNISVSRSFAQGNVVVHDFVFMKEESSDVSIQGFNPIYYKEIESNATKYYFENMSDSDNEKISDQVSCIGDLALFDLHGRVKTAIIEQSDETCLGLSSPGEYEFNQEGSLTKSDGFPVEEYLPNIGYTREGRIKSWGNEPMYEYTYQDGKLVGIWYSGHSGQSSCTIKYDENGDICMEEEELTTYDYGTRNYRTNKFKKTRKYTIIERDKHGNWTKRKMLNERGKIEIETRTIIYYD